MSALDMFHTDIEPGDHRTLKKIKRIHAWYEIEKTNRLNELDSEKAALLKDVQAYCEHVWEPWREESWEMVAGWVTHYERNCVHCRLSERQDTKPDVPYEMNHKDFPNPF